MQHSINVQNNTSKYGKNEENIKKSSCFSSVKNIIENHRQNHGTPF